MIKLREVYCNARGKYVRMIDESDHLAAIEQAKVEAVRDFMDWLAANFERGDDVWSMADKYTQQLRERSK